MNRQIHLPGLPISVSAFNLADAGLGRLFLRQIGPESANVAQAPTAVGDVVAGLSAGVLVLRRLQFTIFLPSNSNSKEHYK